MGQNYLWDIVVGHQISENRERGRVGIGWSGGRIEAKVSDRINFEDGAASVMYGERAVRQYEVIERRNGVLAKGFLSVFSCLTQEVETTPSIRERGTLVASSQADASQISMRAGFGAAMVADVCKDETHLIVS